MIETKTDIIRRILGEDGKNHSGRINPRSVNRYVFTMDDELLAIDLYKKGSSDAEIREAIKDTDIKYTSMKMKISNIRYLDTGDGLANISETTRTLFNQTKKA